MVSNWLSAYIYSADLNSVLGRIVPEILKQGEGLYSKFFFIRYYENGSHIRLRLLCNHLSKKMELQILITQLVEYNHYKIEIVPYEPELERYGGDLGVEFAESLFQFSSQFVLDLIAQVTLNQEVALGVALQLQMVFLNSFFNSTEEQIQFLAFGEKIWTKCAIESGQAKIDNYIKSRNVQFVNQKEKIYRSLRTLLAILHSNGGFDDPLFKEWQLNMEYYSEKFYDSFPHFEFNNLRQFRMKEESERSVKWFLIDSYIHMTNNRLGVLYDDEAFCYMILKSFLIESGKLEAIERNIL